MRSSDRKKALNKSTRFEINPKSICTKSHEGFDENSVSTSRKKLLIPLAGIMFFLKNWPTFNFKIGVHQQKKALNKSKRFVINKKTFPLARMRIRWKKRFQWTKRLHPFESVSEVCTAKIEDFTIENSTKEKLLGVKFDSNLSFEGHVTSLCKKASQKLHALARISHYMDLNKRRSLMKAFITSIGFPLWFPLAEKISK